MAVSRPETVNMQLDCGVTAATPRPAIDADSSVQLSIALTSNPRTWPVIDGSARRMQHVDYYLETGLICLDTRQALRQPLVQHGVEANRKVLERITRYSYEQGLSSRRIALEELFAPSTLESRIA